MKKYITCTLLCIINSYILNAQGKLSPEFSQISTPYPYANDISLNGKNFYFDSSWVKARILASDNTIISSDACLFNFDKIDHRLLITTDFKKDIRDRPQRVQGDPVLLARFGLYFQAYKFY